MIDAEILEHVVELRPVRPTVRVEESFTGPGHARMLHNHGHGGSGITLGWSCAEDVLAMAGSPLEAGAHRIRYSRNLPWTSGVPLARHHQWRRAQRSGCPRKGHAMKSWFKWIAVAVTVAAIAVVAPTAAQAAPYCGITWGSLDKSAGSLSPDPLVNVRAGQHNCFDRLVLDLDGAPAGYTVSYVPAIGTENGELLPLRGGAFLLISLQAPTYDAAGSPTYSPANPAELASVNGWRTFRQVSLGDSFEGYTTIGLGVRARLPFRVFTLDGPGDNSRLVIDVAHKW